MLRLENLNLLSRRERAALAFPKVASILPEDIVLAQVQTEVNNPLLLNLRPSDSAVEHAFKLLGEVSKSTYKSEKVIVDSDDDGEEDQATVTIGRLGTFSRIHFVFFRQYAILLQKLLESDKNKSGFQRTTKVYRTLTMSEMYCTIVGLKKRLSDMAHA